MRIDVNLSTSYHPQADGRSEKTNKTIGQILRHLTATRHSKWLDVLPSVEYAINSAINVATGTSPFEFVYGCKPSLFPITTDTATVGDDVRSWIEKRQSSWASFRDKLWQSRVEQAIQYNKRRRQGAVLQTGDWVLINSKDRQQVVGGDGKPTAKLRPRFDGPYQVEETLNDS